MEQEVAGGSLTEMLKLLREECEQEWSMWEKRMEEEQRQKEECQRHKEKMEKHKKA